MPDYYIYNLNIGESGYEPTFCPGAPSSPGRPGRPDIPVNPESPWGQIQGSVTVVKSQHCYCQCKLWLTLGPGSPAPLSPGAPVSPGNPWSPWERRQHEIYRDIRADCLWLSALLWLGAETLGPGSPSPGGPLLPSGPLGPTVPCKNR